MWKNVQAIRGMLNTIAADAVKKLGLLDISPGTIDNIANRIPQVRFKIIPTGQELAATTSLLAAAESSPEFKFAEAHFRPLVEAAEERDAADEKVRIDRQQAEAQLNQARESSLRAALERAEQSPDILKATARLDAAKEAENMLR